MIKKTSLRRRVGITLFVLGVIWGIVGFVVAGIYMTSEPRGEYWSGEDLLRCQVDETCDLEQAFEKSDQNQKWRKGSAYRMGGTMVGIFALVFVGTALYHPFDPREEEDKREDNDD